ncbi:MAG: glycosyltransferase 87 family protein, partial [Saprospiraceae bacterium]
SLWLLYGLIWWKFRVFWKWWILIGVSARLLLVFAPTLWSDDVFRFIWDGRCWVNGIHPFLHTPDWFASGGFPVQGLDAGLYSLLNSPQYYTVYPPLAQAIFAFSTWLFPASLWGSTIVMKGFVWVCEAGSIEALRRMQGNRPGVSWALVYALNPLAIMEGCGNVHLDVAGLCFVLWGLYLLHRQQLYGAASCWAFAVALKLTPLLFLPLVWRFLGFRRGLVFMVFIGLVSGVLFLPLLSLEVLGHMAESLDLYFRQFQFNASMYYLMQWIGYQRVGYDIGERSGPYLALFTLAAVLLLAFWTPPQDKGGTVFQLAGTMTWAAFAHLSLAAVVHPWYVLLPFGICLISGWRFPVMWTGVVILSYSHYAAGTYTEKHAWIIIEYAAVWFFALTEFILWNHHRRSNLRGSGTAR